jgi:hypothetical protein
VIAESFGARGRQTAGFLVESLGLANAVYVRDADLNQRLIQNNNLLFIGFPKNVSLLSGIPATLSVGPSKFSIGADIHDTREDALFAVFPHPLDKARVAGLFYAPGTIPNVRTALKITHYGRYSYLSFRDGKNTHKGVWPVVASPLIVRWEEEEKDRL